jgi:hypothetical protein
MAKSLALQHIPTLDPDADEGEEKSTFDQAILRVINNNFRSIALAMGGTMDTSNFLDNPVLGNFNGSWTDFTTRIGQTALGIPLTIAKSRYFVLGDLVVYSFYLNAAGLGAAGNPVTVETPSNMSMFGGGNPIVGSGYIFNGTVNAGVWAAASATTLQLFVDGSFNAVGANPSFQIAPGNSITGTIVYEGV